MENYTTITKQKVLISKSGAGYKNNILNNLKKEMQERWHLEKIDDICSVVKLFIGKPGGRINCLKI